MQMFELELVSLVKEMSISIWFVSDWLNTWHILQYNAEQYKNSFKPNALAIRGFAHYSII